MLRGGVWCCLTVGLALSAGTAARGQDVPNNDKARIDALAKQVQTLTDQLKQMQSMPPGSPSGGAALGGPIGLEQDKNLTKDEVKSIVTDYLKERDAKKKTDDDRKKLEDEAKREAEGYKVGSDLKMSASWAEGLLLTTGQKDFWMHIGGWIQYDNVFFTQSTPLKVAQSAVRAGPPQKVGTGPFLGGIGDLEDGTYFRRLRLMTDGVFYDNFEFTLIYAFENDQFNTIGLDEFWVGMKDIPFLGTVRIGHVKNAIGLEADMTGSSRTMTFMERSAYSEAIELNQNFVTGIWIGNNYLDKRATSTFVLFRPDQGASSGAFFGDGQYGMQGRLTALPLYENDGRCLTHVGISGGWRNGTSNIANTPLRTVQLRDRPELRDDDPAGAGGGIIPDANSNRLIDTGNLGLRNQWLCGLEFLQIWGPLSLQAEYGWNWIEDSPGFNPAGVKFVPPTTSPQNYVFEGGYVQLAYTLTGENRAYDRRLGRLDTYYFGRKGPYNNFWFVQDEDGGTNSSFGAWEIAARYGHVNLNDGVGANRVQGGVLDTWTVGLNWYLNVNLKMQFDYVYDHRFDLPAGVNAGWVSGFGMRMQFMY
jgi:phosphate-selective porin OprO/OprP